MMMMMMAVYLSLVECLSQVVLYFDGSLAWALLTKRSSACRAGCFALFAAGAGRQAAEKIKIQTRSVDSSAHRQSIPLSGS